MNRREDKFKIVTGDELEVDNSTINNIEIVDTPSEVNIEKADYAEKLDDFNDKKEEVVENEISDKRYIGFGTRIFVMLIISLMLLGISGILIVKTINYSNKELIINDNGWNNYTIMFAVMASLLIIIALVLILRVTRLVLKVTNNNDKYQQRLMQILKTYDRIIVVAKDGYENNSNKEVIKLDDFDKLLDIKDSLNKPIIFSKINDIKSEFIVENEDKLYKYILKDEDV